MRPRNLGSILVLSPQTKVAGQGAESLPARERLDFGRQLLLAVMPAASANLARHYHVYRFRYSILLRAMVVGSGSYLKTSTESHFFHPIALTAAAMGP